MQAEWFKAEVFGLKDLLYRLALRLLDNTEEAEDAVQQVMMKMWQKREELSNIEHLRPFVIKSLKNECINRLQQKQSIAQHHMQIVKLHQNPIEMLPGNLVEVIKKEIDKLPEKQRMIMHLCDVEGFDTKEIALIADIDEGAVRVNLSRARNKIKSQIKKIRAYEERQL